MTRPSGRLAAVVTAVACAALVSAVPASAISGGAATEQRSLAQLDVGESVSCSGALVTPEWVLTSAACFAAVPSQPETPSAGAPHVATTATLADQVRQVDRIVPRIDRDIVLAHLDAPVTDVAPVALSESAPATGESVEVSGHGRTATEWVPAQPSAAEFTVDSVAATTLILQGSVDGTSVCLGDAGGPVLADGQLVAVASGSHQGGCLGTTEATDTGATAARTDDLSAWVSAEIFDLTATPASKHAINLTWDATGTATDYRVYGARADTVALEPGNLLGETTDTGFTHTNLPSGQTWSYRIVGLDDSGAQIAASAVATAVSPTNTTTDFNGDGRDDIATFNGITSTIGVAASTGAAFGAAETWTQQLAAGTPMSGDFNGDGTSDVVTFDNGPVNVALSDGQTFAAPRVWHARFGLGNQRMSTGDFNGDGKDDVVTFLRGDGTTDGGGNVYVSLSTGENFIDDDQLWSDWFAVGDEIPGVGDFNGDDRSDVITFTRGGDALVYVARSDSEAFENGTQWHGNFADGAQWPLPSARR